MMDILLDSGAFSAWNRGERIDLSAYIDFVKANKGLNFRYINLDVIPEALVAVSGDRRRSGRRTQRLIRTTKR